MKKATLMILAVGSLSACGLPVAQNEPVDFRVLPVAGEEGEGAEAGGKRGFQIGAVGGAHFPDANKFFGVGIYYEVRYAFEIRESLDIETHFGFVDYDTDSRFPDDRYDMRSIIPAVSIKQYQRFGKLDLFERVGIGFMINDASSSTVEDRDGVVIPIGIGLEYRFLDGKLRIVGEVMHHWTEARFSNGPELDATILLLGAAFGF